MKCILMIIMLFAGMSQPLKYTGYTDFEDIPKEITVHLAKMGVDGTAILNSYESAYFNAVFEETLNGFDFTYKKVMFFRGSIEDKVDYFNDTRKRFHNNEGAIVNYFCAFDAVQKEKVGGYDAVIVCWSKFYTPAEDIVKFVTAKRKKTAKR